VPDATIAKVEVWCWTGEQLLLPGSARRGGLTDGRPMATVRCVPICDFACSSCDEIFEELCRSDAPSPACPSCGTETKRLLSTFLTPNMASGQRHFQRDVGSALAAQGCCGGGGCATHA